MTRAVRLGAGGGAAEVTSEAQQQDPLDPRRLLEELKRIRGYRMDSHMAEELGITRSWLAQIQTGYREMPPNTKLRLLDALCLDPPRDALLEWLLPASTREALQAWDKARRENTGPRRGPRVRSPLPTGVGARLQEERVRLGLTKRALADALGATEKTIYNYERDATSMSVATLEILGKLGADVEYVTFGERAKPRKGRAD